MVHPAVCYKLFSHSHSWPSQIPDLNPIEQIWDLVDSKIDCTQVLSKEVFGNT